VKGQTPTRLRRNNRSAQTLRCTPAPSNAAPAMISQVDGRKGRLVTISGSCIAKVSWNGYPCARVWLTCFAIKQVSMQANSRYLQALALVDDPTKGKRDLDRITTRKKDPAGRGCSDRHTRRQRARKALVNAGRPDVTYPAQWNETRPDSMQSTTTAFCTL
jgi:hypothetical protein